MTLLDVDAYFERIGYSGSGSANLDTLAAIHLRHAQTIPFENLNPLLRWPVRLDAHSLQQKLVRDSRGGYCFEQNLLLSHILNQLGFHVRGLAARVLWNVPEGTVTPRGHMLLLIDLAGRPYIADVGFGGLTLTAPLGLVLDIEQSTPHEPFRLIRSGDGFVMQAKTASTWRSLYQFDLQPQFLPDYEVTNWYLSNHPSSHFVTGLIAARADSLIAVHASRERAGDTSDEWRQRAPRADERRRTASGARRHVSTEPARWTRTQSGLATGPHPSRLAYRRQTGSIRLGGRWS